MRAVFTVDLPLIDEQGYPTDQQIVELVRSYGWEPVEVCTLMDEEAKLQKCRELATYLFEDMPPGAASRLEHVLTYGYLSDDYTRFVVIRLVDGQITFRLANTVLGRLQTSTAKVIRKILKSQINGQPLRVCNQSVVVYERGNDFIVLSGRVIPNPLKETFRSDRKSVLIAGVALFIFLIVISLLLSGMDSSANRLLGGTLERISTAMLTAALVSTLNLTETYLEIYRNKVVVW
jgi:hypothetical protein